MREEEAKMILAEKLPLTKIQKILDYSIYRKKRVAYKKHGNGNKTIRRRSTEKEREYGFCKRCTSFWIEVKKIKKTLDLYEKQEYNIDIDELRQVFRKHTHKEFILVYNKKGTLFVRRINKKPVDKK